MCIIRIHAPRIKCKNLEKLIAKNDSAITNLEYNKHNQNEIAHYVRNRLDQSNISTNAQVYQYNGDELSLPDMEVINPRSEDLQASEEGNKKKWVVDFAWNRL